MKPNHTTWILVLAAFLIASTPAARADGDAQPSPVNATVVTLDPSKPDSCQRFHEFIQNNQVQVQDPQVRQSLENSICHPVSRNTLVSVIVLRQADSGDSGTTSTANRTTISFDVGMEAAHGNDNYIHLNGSFDFSRNWANRHLLRVHAEGEYESDSTVARAIVTPDYMYDLTQHTAVFGVVSLKHDQARDLTFGSEEYAGLLYNLFPFAESQDHFLMVSAGIGHRYDNFDTGYIRNHPIASYRAAFMAHLAKQFQMMTAIWFQHVVNDPSDYRVLFQLKMQYGEDTGFHANLQFEDEYWSDPIPGTDNNDVRVTAGFGYTFQ